MRVLFVSHQPELGGGAERSLVELATGLGRDPAFHCLVAARRRGALLERAAAAGATTIVAPTPRWVVSEPARGPLDRSTRRALLSCLLALPAWFRLLRRHRPDVVVTSTTTIPTAAIAARILGIAHLWFVTELLVDHPDRRYALGPRRTAQVIDRLSRRLLATSSATADHLPGIPRTRVRVIPPSCSLPSPDHPPAPSDPRRALRLLVLARFEPGKGAETAMAAVHRARVQGADVALRLVGSAQPAYRARLERQAAQSRSRDAIVWVDPTDDPAQELDRCDVALSPTTIDAFGRVTAEAMRRGRPVVGAAAGGTVELIEDGVNGLLYPPDDVPALAEIIGRLAADRDEVDRLARGAWETGRSRFLPEHRVHLFRAALTDE
jgi:glycosyltransferase involved in cell wall biosynthesis